MSSSSLLSSGRLLSTLLAAAVLVTACGGVPVNDDPDVTPTGTTSAASPTAAATSEPTATATEAVERPADFDDWSGAILRSLNDSSAQGCPVQLLEDWEQTEPAPRCLETDLNADGADDLVILLERPVFQEGVEQSGQVIALLAGEEDYILAYEEDADAGITGLYVLGTADVDGDERPEFAYMTTECDGEICQSTVQVVGFQEQRLAVIPGDVSGANLSEVEFADFVRTTPGQEIELTGDVIQTVESGPQRSPLRLFGYVEGTMEELPVPGESSPYLYHHIRDADALFDAGDFETAITAYAAALADTTLLDWHAEIGQGSDREQLVPYALFRRGVAESYLGLAEQKTSMEGAFAAGGVFAAAAGAFQSNFATTGDVAQACAAALEWLPPESVNAALSYGFLNPAPAPAEICPF